MTDNDRREIVQLRWTRLGYGRSGRKYCSQQCYIEERFGGKDDQENVTA